MIIVGQQMFEYPLKGRGGTAWKDAYENAMDIIAKANKKVHTQLLTMKSQFESVPTKREIKITEFSDLEIQR
jgi:hypothetical protein